MTTPFTIVGQISNKNETEYQKKIECLLIYCKDNNLSLRGKELIIDFNKQKGSHAPIDIKGTEVEMVDCFKFPGVTIINILSWSVHVDVKVKKAQQHLFFLRRLWEV
eukprot:g34945.t1